MQEYHRKQLEQSFDAILRELAPDLARQPELLQKVQQRLMDLTVAWGSASPEIEQIQADICRLVGPPCLSG